MKRKRRSNKTKKIGFLTLLSIIFLISFSFSYFFNYLQTKNNTKVVSAINDTEKTKDKKNKTGDGIPTDILNSKDEISDSQNKDLRKFPYPYSSMLAICSDIDDTTLEEFKTYHKFLNTKEQTPYGEGVGLDIGDSMWMYIANNIDYQTDANGDGTENIMTFFKGVDKTQKHNADEISHYFNVGWIDCLHTFGDFSGRNERRTAFNRSLAIAAWDALKSANINPLVWINHGNKSNKQNFGAYGTSNFMSYQQGDNPQSAYYNSDLDLQNGIKYLWDSRGDYNFGHDYPLYEISLRDGKKFWGFYRYTNNIINNKPDWTWVPKELYRQLTPENLDNLVKNKNYSIVGQHFGVYTEDLFTAENIQALRLLKQYETNNKILVAKTTRLLNYANVHKSIMYNKVTDDGKIYINISSINDSIFGRSTPKIDDVRGLTFYCDSPENTVLLLNKSKIDSSEIQINPKDETGQASISIKWFKPDFTDYTK